MKLRLLVIFVLLISTNSSYSAVIGLPESTLKYGIGTRVGIHNIRATYGNTQEIKVVQPFNLIATDWLSNGLSYWVELYYASYRFEATQNNIGQQLNQTGARASIIHNIYVGKYFQPWLGIGIDTAYSKFSRRHNIDFEGFLAQRFEDENKLDAGFLIHAHNAWDFSKDLSMGLKGEYRVPFSDSLQSTTFEVFILYRNR